MNKTVRHLLVSASCALALLTVAVPAARALEPEQIVLVVNSRVPESRKLAEFYAEQRNVPKAQILALEFPFPQEDIAPDLYEKRIRPKLREFLETNGLKDKVTCLVTFYGVPIRITRRANTAAENEEALKLATELKTVTAQVESAVAEVERLARQVEPRFEPPAKAAAAPKSGGAPEGVTPATPAAEMPELAKRAQQALGVSIQGIAGERNEQIRRDLFTRWVVLFEKLAGTVDTMEKLAQPDLAKLAVKPVTPEQLEKARKRVADLQKQFADAQAAGGEKSRATMRRIVKENFGLFKYAGLLQGQQLTFKVEETESALDSELAMLWWNDYPRHRWQFNLLNYRVAGSPQVKDAAPTMMVMRLDGPSEKIVRDLITTSMKVEETGLKGRVLLDGRGIPASDSYGQYDQTIRNLGLLLKSKTQLDVVMDDKPDLFPPQSQKDVAVYCGWYSLHKYVPAFSFNPGAVGFHVASAEMTSLRNTADTGWVPGLLKDGVCGTLGPVAEPYLQSFPPADEFFPLLLTGKLTLAEVYWKTNPMASWMNACIGDPLYTPFKANPALKVEDLPQQLQRAVEPPAAATTEEAATPAAAPATTPEEPKEQPKAEPDAEKSGK